MAVVAARRRLQRTAAWRVGRAAGVVTGVVAPRGRRTRVVSLHRHPGGRAPRRSPACPPDVPSETVRGSIRALIAARPGAVRVCHDRRRVLRHRHAGRLPATRRCVVAAREGRPLDRGTRRARRSDGATSRDSILWDDVRVGARRDRCATASSPTACDVPAGARYAHGVARAARARRRCTACARSTTCSIVPFDGAPVESRTVTTDVDAAHRPVTSPNRTSRRRGARRAAHRRCLRPPLLRVLLRGATVASCWRARRADRLRRDAVRARRAAARRDAAAGAARSCTTRSRSASRPAGSRRRHAAGAPRRGDRRPSTRRSTARRSASSRACSSAARSCARTRIRRIGIAFDVEKLTWELEFFVKHFLLRLSRARRSSDGASARRCARNGRRSSRSWRRSRACCAIATITAAT